MEFILELTSILVWPVTLLIIVALFFWAIRPTRRR